MGPGRLLAVCVGHPRMIERQGYDVPTAIWKEPVEGRVAVRGVNVDGDDQADRTVHGGPDKAVYAYAAEDTRHWEDVLGRDVGPGGFGENLWLEGVDLSGAVVGERWAIGTTVLEVSEPRIPCWKLGARFGDPRMLKWFAAAERPGTYLRIVEEGELGAGDPVEVVHRPDHGFTIRAFNRAILHEPALRAQLAGVPDVAERWRAWAANSRAV